MNKFDLPRREPYYQSRVGTYSIQNSRISNSLQHRPIGYSPRANDFRDKKLNFHQNDNKMRMFKSRVHNVSINSKNGFQQNNLFPEELLFLLGNEEGNVQFIRNKIENQKQKINKQFEHFMKEISHIVEDLKVSVDARLDQVYCDFIAIYKQLKTNIADLRQIRRQIMHSFNENQGNIRPPSNYSVSGLPNQTAKSIQANQDLLQQIGKDAEYFRNHRLYEQVTNAHLQAMGPIMSIVNDIITIGGYQQSFYSQKNLNQIFAKLKQKLQNSIKQVFDQDLVQTIIDVKQIIEDNNMLLKGLNIGDQIKNDDKMPEFNQASGNYTVGISPINKNIGGGSNKTSYNSQNHRNLFPQKQSPYGLGLPYRKQDIPQKQRMTSNYGRPSSKTQYQQYSPRKMSGWDTSYKTQIEADKNRNISSGRRNNSPKISSSQQVLQIQKIQDFRLRLSYKTSKILVNQAQSSLLSVIFVNNGKNIVVGSRDFKIYVFQTATGKLITKLNGHEASVCSLADFGNFFVSGGDNGCNSVIFWDPTNWKLRKKINSIHGAAVSCILNLGDGSSLATGGYDKNINIYNYKLGEIAFNLNSNRSAVCALSWNHHNRKMISAGLDQTLTVWSTFFTNGVISDMNLERIITNAGLVCSMQSLNLAYDYCVIGNKQGKVKIINVNSGQCMKTFTVGNGSVVELAVVQRQNKPLAPLIMSCSHRSKDLILTKSQISLNSILQTDNKINIQFGCGIGPKIIFNNANNVAILSQSPQDKSISIYELDGS